jgi:Protein of unknown function (DUF3800)
VEYIIYADESDEEGPYFSNFYGGLLVRSPHLPYVLEQLRKTKTELHLHGRAKWQKVTAQYLDKYLALMEAFFDLVDADLVKVRVMFQHRTHVAVGLTDEQKRTTYHLLYYQFLKHAFGLQHAADPRGHSVAVRFYLDQRGGTDEKRAQFRSYIAALGNQPQFRAAKILFPADQITEVALADHDLLQCLDVVLGAMQFRLNDRHKAKPSGAKRRAARTVAKEKLYKAILARVRTIHPGFNIGITTGTKGDRANRWKQAYRHWDFTPSESRYDPTRVKPK